MTREDKVKHDAGYVQVESFSDAGVGYFCGTCAKIEPLGGKDGFCRGLQVPIRTYGCCNYWAMGRPPKLAASGKHLRVLR
jgi:hypothetical protein